MKEDELLSYCEDALRACEAEGAEEAEAFALSRTRIEVSLVVRGGEPDVAATGTSRLGLAMRAYADGRLGFSYTTDLSEKALREAARAALRASRPVEGFKGFPNPGGTRRRGVYDRRVAELTGPDLLDLLEGMVDEARGGGDGLEIPSAYVGACSVAFAIANSSGLEVREEGTFVGANLSALAAGAPESISSSQVRRKLDQLDTVALAHDVARKALAMAGAGEIRPGEHDVVLSPWVLAELLSYSFVGALRADNVRLGTSVLKGKLGEQVASEALSISDDPTHPLGLCTFGTDDEGWPTERKPIVERGVLRAYLYDSLEAGLQGLEAGGNCIRWEPPVVDPFYPRDYRFRPGIYPTNLVVEPGHKSFEELLEHLGEGLYAFRSLSGFGMAPSGDFALYMTSAFRVEGGELGPGLRGLSLRGNVFEVLKAIRETSSDLEPLLPDMAGFCVISPHALAEGLEVVA